MKIMTTFQITKPQPILEGTLSTLQDAEVRPAYAEAVKKLVRDNSSMGEKWQGRVLDLLLTPMKTPSDDGTLIGSNPYMNTLLARIGIPLVELPRLRQAYEQNNNKSPFPGNYVETGLALIPERGNYQINRDLAKILDTDFKKRNIPLGKGRVPNFSQLMLVPDQTIGLAFTLNETADKNNVPNLRDFNWNYGGKNGLFRAYLNNYSDWCADGGLLENSNSCGRVVEYNAEGVAPKNLTPGVQMDKISKRLADFISVR